jgi:peptidoglycan/LPS O-acetylase OafA/YrhL
MYLQRLSNWLWGSGILVLIFVALWQAQAETHRNATPNFAALNFLEPLKPSYAWLGEPLAGFGFALCIVAILFGPPALKWLFEIRPLRWIGMISYGLYMWHVNLLITLNTWLSPYLKGWTGVIEKDIIFWSFVFLVVMPFSYLFYRVIERPGIRLGARLTHGKSEQFSTPSIS